MKKRVVSLFLCVVMLVSLLSVNAFAATVVKLEAQKVKAELSTNATVKVKVAITENSGIICGSYGVKWDSSALELTKVNFLMSNLPDAASPAIENNGEYWVSFGNDLATTNVTAKGDAFELVFKVLAGATAKEYPITIEPDNRAFRDAGASIVPPQAVNGSITLKAKTVPVTSVAVSPKTLDLEVGQTGPLTATVNPDNATNKAVIWSTSNDKVADVADGKVTAVAPGEAFITATTADGGFTATCKVTVTEKPCEHPEAKLTKVDAKEATCTEPGNAECWKCGECGKYLSTDKSTEQKTIFGYAPALGHEYGHLVAAVAPTCTVNGKVAYYQCSRCEKYFNADKNPITSIVAPATGHVVIQHHAAVAATCVAEGSNEYWSCANCDAKFADKYGKTLFVGEIVTPVNKTNHASELKHHDAVASTCVKKGNIEYWSCASCKMNFSDAEGKTRAENVTLSVDASAHTIVNVPAKPHTCTEDGIITHYKCTGCGKLFSDKAGENEITNIVDPAAHKLTPVAEKPSTCRVNGTGAYNKCEVCGKMFDKDTNKEITAVPVLELAAHTWDNVWHANSTGHYHECTVCGIAGDVTAHTPGAEATETTAQTCTICGYIIKPATSHKEHTKGNLMSDATSHWYACTGCSEQLEKANHTVTSWTVDKAATTTEEGLRHGNCSVCQHVVYEKLAKINNTPVNPSKPGRPSGTKTVQSGKTFDAGVGVYVGLSILSLTGSAVVIGKKRKTR